MNSLARARLPLALGYGAVIVLVAGLGGWGLGTEIAGAIVARGVVEVENKRQVVEHPDGGVVGAILARNGASVEKGDVLIHLDDTFLLSQLEVVEKQLVEFYSRAARLVAERDGAEIIAEPDLSEYHQLSADWVNEHVSGQKNLFEAREQTLSEELNQLDEQRSQIDEEIEGVEAELSALDTQLDLISSERNDLEGLLEEGLVPAGRVLELKRNEAQIKGQIGQLNAQKAQARTRQSEIAIKKLSLVDTRREQAITQLRDLEYSRIQLEEKRRSLNEQLSRLDVRAPASGTVFGSTVATVGSVIRAAEPMMYIVPQSQPLEVSARIQPTDIDQVFPGQDVNLRFTAFSSRTIPTFPGNVTRISADAETDKATGFTFYEAVVAPDAAAISAQPDVDLLPGMPVEVFLRTEDRTPLSYLLQPLAVYFERALR